jgi:hypothetical protein
VSLAARGVRPNDIRQPVGPGPVALELWILCAIPVFDGVGPVVAGVLDQKLQRVRGESRLVIDSPSEKRVSTTPRLEYAASSSADGVSR